MNKIAKYFPWVLGLAALVLLCFYLDAAQRYLFYYREQQQLFVYDTSFMLDRYLTFGGFALFMAQFLVQFFTVPFMGALITSILAVLTAVLLWLSLRKINGSAYLFPLCFLPILFQIGALYDYYYYYQGLVAFSLMASSLYL